MLHVLQMHHWYSSVWHRGALQIQDWSLQSRNWRPVEACNAKFSRDRSAMTRPVSDCGLLCLPCPFEGVCVCCFYVLSFAGFIVDNVVECDVWKYYLWLFPTCFLSLFSSCACENVIGCCVELDRSHGNGIHVYKTGLVLAVCPMLHVYHCSL